MGEVKGKPTRVNFLNTLLNGIPSRIFFENGIPERMMRKGEHR
jgi:hypothetical protein